VVKIETEKLNELFESLTLEEKIAQTVLLNGDTMTEDESVLTGPKKDLGFNEEFDFNEVGSIFNLNNYKNIYKLQKKNLENSRHKIPLLFMSDVIYGFRTIFPIPIAQAGSYDFSLIKKGAEITAKESYLNGIHAIFSPVLDLSRDPRWGRVMESPGEDVYTAKRFAKNVVTGYQGENTEKLSGNHVAAGIKHFAAYGAPEAGREYSSVDMSNQKLFNEYLQPYEAAIDAHTLLVMTAFNTLNGVPSTGNKWLNRDILRERFGFRGPLISDYAAVEELEIHGFTNSPKDSAQKALKAGVDFDMMTSVYANSLPQLVEDPTILKLLDEAVWRILVLKNKLGLFENPYRGLKQNNTGEVLTEEAKNTAVKLVEKSSVLLKNDSGLPLNKEQTISIIGPYSDSHLTLGFWASVTGKPQDSIPLGEGMKNIFEDSQLKFSKGFNLFDSYEPFGPLKEGIEQLNGPIEDEKKLFKEAIEIAKESDIIVLTIGEQFMESGEGASKAKLSLPTKQIDLIKELAKLNKPIVGILYTGRPLVLTEVEKYLDSILLVWHPGIMGGVGIANILAGKTSPSARLSMTFPRSEGQIPIYYTQNNTGRPLENNKHSTRFVSKYIDELNEPLFKFGHSKSYAEFNSEWLDYKVHDGEINFRYKVKNISEINADTIVHVYVNNITASIVQPKKRLIYSEKMSLEPGQSKENEFIITEEKLSFYNNEGEKVFENGDYEFYLNILGEETKLSLSI